MAVATTQMTFLPRKYSPNDDRINNNTPVPRNQHRRMVLKKNLQSFPTNDKQIGLQPSQTWTKLKASRHAKNTVNPIRKIADKMSVPPNPDKYPIKLNLGDPTVMGNLPPSEASIAAIIESVQSHKSDGYGVSVGTLAARQAVADTFSLPSAPIDPDNVILASGCSHALQMALEAVADPGDNILVPFPGFPLYTTLCTPHDVETRGYQLKMDEDGLIDLVDLESKIDSHTRAIIINNPSNPTGIVFPKEHLEDILKVAEKHHVIIIADEIYGNLTYDEKHKFIPIASLTPKVPVITCDGIGKRFLVPGWRLGWAVIHNRHGVLDEVREGMIALSQKIVGPCSLIQGALPKILKETPPSYFENITSVLRENAEICMKAFEELPCMKPLKPHGAMYLMVKIDEELLGEETEVVQDLIRNESVYCLPGSAFNCPGWIRLVLTLPPEVTREACDRISKFCVANMVKQS